MIVGSNREILQALRASPVSEWPEFSLDFQHTVTQLILCQEQDMAEEYEAGRYFGPPRFPGTTSIGYRQRNPEIFQDTTESTYETYPDWVRRSLSSILRKMEIKGLLPASDDLPNAPTEEIVQKIDKMLTFEALGGVPLCEAIPQQLYEDIFIRMVALLLEEESTSATINFYREFNAICHRIALALIDRLESEGIIGTEINRIAKLIQIAVLSGYVGINLKSSASAASTLLNRDFAPLKEGWVQSITAVNEVPAAEINQVVDNLLMVSEKPEGQFGLESLLKYQAEVIKTEIPTLLVFFCDDYLESVVDIKRLEVILDGNPHLVVLFIPRSGRYGNDIAYDDMEDILQESQFDSLHKHVKSERFYISPHGPKSGCIDPRYMSKALIGEISTLSKGKRVIFETKGCRNFEMLRGDLQIPWYAGFNCNRALSVRTVGIYGPPVFVRIPPGLRAYDQFVQPAIGHCPSYQTALVRFARMTTRQLYTALGSAFYQTMLERSENELRLNTILTELGDNLNLPFPETIAFLGARQLTD